jgi:hypothetical protein
MSSVKQELYRDEKKPSHIPSSSTLNDASLQLQKQQYAAMLKASSLKQLSPQQSPPSFSTPVKPFPKRAAQTTHERLKRPIIFGQVRATPYGSCLTNNVKEEKDTDNQTHAPQWSQWRKENFHEEHFPVEGFDHVYGTQTIQEQEWANDYGAEAAAVAAHLGPEGSFPEPPQKLQEHDKAREYGNFLTPLDMPIGSLKDKWRVLPHLLKVRSLMRQHIDSFDFFVNVEMKEIVKSPSACEIRSDHDPRFYLKYTNCWVGEPEVQEDSYTTSQATPFQCRLRDCTYSAPIYVDLRYTRGNSIVKTKKVRDFHNFVSTYNILELILWSY